MKKFLLFTCFIAIYSTTFAQQFALFDTQTMFDAFENPSQKSFTLDSSRKFSSNFFLPGLAFRASNTGESEFVIRKLTQESINDTRSLPLNTGKINQAFINSNIYLANFRIFQSYKYQKEIGFAWQIRTDGYVGYQNEELAIFDSYTRFDQNTALKGIFNANGYEQSYHQFSFTYRENYNKRLAFGLKASILSGITYMAASITDSYLFINPESNYLNIGLKGNYRSTITDTEKFNTKSIIPTFKNPGFSFSFGSNYKTKKGLFLMANIKDLGFIWWRNNPQYNSLNTYKTIEDIAMNQPNTNREIREIFKLNESSQKFVTPTNAKIDVYMSKVFGFYKPALAISKNLFYKGGDAAFINTFNYNNYSASLTPAYNFSKIFMVGLQGKYQTKNFEIFAGSDDLFKTANMARGIITDNAYVGSGPNSASFYTGIGIKFGNIVNHPQFSDTMPGIDSKESGSFFKWLTSWL